MMLDHPANSNIVPADIARLIVSPQAYARQTKLLAAFRRLRETNPVGRVEIDQFDPFWVVTRHADIQSISRRHDLFSNGKRATALVPRATDQKVRTLTGGSPHLIRTLVHMDAPDHIEYRRITQAWFTQGSFSLQHRIRTLARDCIDRMIALGGECDFVSDVARLFPLQVMLGLLGAPPEDASHLLALTENFFRSQDDFANGELTSAKDPGRHAAHLVRVFADFAAYFRPLLKDRASRSRDDLLTAIATATIDGKPIPEFEAIGYLLILATAGHHTTSSSIAGGVWALSERPDELAKVMAQRDLIPSLVDEAVRWTAPVQHFMRTAVTTTTIAARRIEAGDWLMLSYLSASRDDSIFENADAFRVDRSTGVGMTFGHGVHICLGQHLARLEMRIFFEEMLSRIDRIALAGEPKRSASIFVGGPISVPIRYRVRGPAAPWPD
jgi:cytochrome P450